MTSTQSIATFPMQLSKQDLMGSWKIEQLHEMIKHFNKTDTDESTRAIIMNRLLSSQMVFHVVHGNLDSIVPRRAYHFDLCFEQINKAGRKHAIDQCINFSLIGKGPTEKEWREILLEAEKTATEKGMLSKPYKRKYPDNPNIFAIFSRSISAIKILKGNRSQHAEQIISTIPLAGIREIKLVENSPCHEHNYMNLHIQC